MNLSSLVISSIAFDSSSLTSSSRSAALPTGTLRCTPLDPSRRVSTCQLAIWISFSAPIHTSRVAGLNMEIRAPYLGFAVTYSITESPT